MATAKQAQLVQTARRVVGLNELAYRVLLLNVAHVDSTKDLNNVSVEDVMSVLEGLGFSDKVHGRNYWTTKVEQRGTYANARMVHKLRELAAEQGRYPLDAMCRRHSDKRTDRPELLYPREAWIMIEAYKAILAREAEQAVPPPPVATPNYLPGQEPVTDDEIPF